MKFPLPVLIALLFLIHSSLHSQQGWRRLTTNDGLSDNRINTIFQTQNGHIWIATDKGTDRYNGLFERVWGLNGPVNIIFQSSTGQLFARLDMPDGPLGSWVYATSSLHFFDGLEWKDIDTLDDVSKMPEFAVESGELWVSTLDGLVSSDGQKWQLYDPDVSIDWLVKTPDGRLWTVKRSFIDGSWRVNGIASFDGQKWTTEFNTDNDPFSEVITNTVLVLATGHILLGTDTGLFRYDPNSNSLSPLSLGQISIQFILEAANDAIWVVARDPSDHGLLYR